MPVMSITEDQVVTAASSSAAKWRCTAFIYIGFPKSIPICCIGHSTVIADVGHSLRNKTNVQLEKELPAQRNRSSIARTQPQLYWHPGGSRRRHVTLQLFQFFLLLLLLLPFRNTSAFTLQNRRSSSACYAWSSFDSNSTIVACSATASRTTTQANPTSATHVKEFPRHYSCRAKPSFLSGERERGAGFAAPIKMENFLHPLQQRVSLFQILQGGPLRVSIVGSGNWGSVIGKVVANNAARSFIFRNEVRMWVYEEMCEGKKLTELINTTHENKKYLPRVTLPENLVAIPDIAAACRDADLLVFVLPHQFVQRACDQLKNVNVVPSHARAITLLKGLHIDGGRPKLFSDIINKTLNISGCAALSGANVANDVAQEQFAEATLGFSKEDESTAMIWQQLFDTPYFKINALPDVAGVQVCGAVKNVIALAAGFCDGLNLGTNTKSAIIRMGVEEMRQFAGLFFDGALTETFFESAGYADVITTVFGGRNARCAAEFVRQQGKKSWEDIEDEMLHGQKLQGTLTTKEVYGVLTAHAVEHLFPLFCVTYEIAFKHRPASAIFQIFQTTQLRAHRTAKECTPIVLPPLMSVVKQRIARLQAIVDHERYREEERKLAAEYESRHMHAVQEKCTNLVTEN